MIEFLDLTERNVIRFEELKVGDYFTPANGKYKGDLYRVVTTSDLKNFGTVNAYNLTLNCAAEFWECVEVVKVFVKIHWAYKEIK